MLSHQRLSQQEDEGGQRGGEEGTHRLLVDDHQSMGDDTALHSPSFEVDAAVLGLSREIPSAQRLLRARPYITGYLLKKRERCFGLCPGCVGPDWRRRFFVISGQYLYRFVSESGPAPKGAPLSLESVTFKALDDEVLPYSFIVSTLSKEMVLAATSDHERRLWIDHIREGKQRSIKESMGHMEPRPEHVPFNRLASKLVKRHSRKAMASSQLHSNGIEMRAFTFNQL